MLRAKEPRCRTDTWTHFKLCILFPVPLNRMERAARWSVATPKICLKV